MSSELENSGIRVAIGDCSVTERQWWRPPYQNCACARKNTINTMRTEARRWPAGCVRQWFRTAEPLGERRYENWNTHTHRVKVKAYHSLIPVRAVGIRFPPYLGHSK